MHDNLNSNIYYYFIVELIPIQGGIVVAQAYCKYGTVAFCPATDMIKECKMASSHKVNIGGKKLGSHSISFTLLHSTTITNVFLLKLKSGSVPSMPSDSSMLLRVLQFAVLCIFASPVLAQGPCQISPISTVVSHKADHSQSHIKVALRGQAILAKVPRTPTLSRQAT